MNFNIRKDANGIEVISPLPHKIIMLMPIFQFFHKNKPSIKSTYLGFVLFSGRQIQRFAAGGTETFDVFTQNYGEAVDRNY